MPGLSYHMGIDVRGVLRQGMAEIRRLAKCATDDNGRPMTAADVEAELRLHAARGHRVIPMGRCDAWDWQDGCRGHADDAEDCLIHDAEVTELPAAPRG